MLQDSLPSDYHRITYVPEFFITLSHRQENIKIMMQVFRIIIGILDTLLSLPFRLLKLLMRPLEFIMGPGVFQKGLMLVVGYFFFSVFLVYVLAPLWGWAAHSWWKSDLDYFDERSRGTAIYDARGEDMGIFDPRLDSEHDLNLTEKAIKYDDMVAFPDHKSLHVSTVPKYYWKCLQYHEDRYFGGQYKKVFGLNLIAPNPYGIDLAGILRIPLANIPVVSKAIGFRRGGGGSTLAMQLSRSYYSTLPSSRETWIDKVKRKLGEWVLAPVLQYHLRGTWIKKKDGSEGWSYTPMKQWAANHLPLAQRAAGSLYGVELTSRIIFGVPANQLTIAQQFTLASAVNKPVIVLKGSPRINRIRLRNWQYITRHRATQCAKALLNEMEEKDNQLTAVLELGRLGDMMPVARLGVQKAENIKLDPRSQKLVGANPVIRANVLLPSSRFAAKAEIKDRYGLEWRKAVKGVRLTVDHIDNYVFRQKLLKALGKLNYKYRKKLDHEYSLDVRAVQKRRVKGKKVPDIIVVAANSRGKIIRFYEASQNAHYYGSSTAFEKNGHYAPNRERRQIASIAKMLAAVAIANEGKDTLNSKYLDTEAPSRGLETCRRQRENGRRKLRRAETVFACSLSNPVANRLVKFGQGPLQHLVESFGFNMPYSRNKQEATPASTAIAHGYITGSPRKVHQLATAILASVRGEGETAVRLPFIVERFEMTSAYQTDQEGYLSSPDDITPDRIIDPAHRVMLKSLLSAPFCYRARGKKYGTLNSLSDWCAARRKDVNIHIGKTGTQVGFQSDQTVDVWVAGGIEFANRQAYSYMILVGTGNASKPLGRQLHSSQLATPLLRVLLDDLKAQSRKDVGRN